MSDIIGQSIDRYNILEQLGRGGMATVYKAYDTRLEREVAIKLVRKEAFGTEVLGRILKRFEQEAKSLAKLSHPDIIKVFDYGEYQGSPFLVMEYIPSGTLKDLLGKPLDPGVAARLLIPVAQALRHAHSEGIIHRDIKPSNILLDKNNEPKLTDFGIARILERESTTSLTATGVGVGTPVYMAPEQGLGKGVDARTDIYSLGVVFYEMITGKKPYEADTPLAVMLKHIYDPLPRPSSLVNELSEQVEQVIFKAMAKQPQDRYQDMEAITNAFQKISMASVYPIPSQPVSYPDTPQDDSEIHPQLSRFIDFFHMLPRWVWGVGVGLALLGILISWGVVGSIGKSTEIPEAGVHRLEEPEVEEPVDEFDEEPSLIPTKSPAKTPTLGNTPEPTLTPTQELGIGSTMISPRDGMVQIYIPAGEFLMGSSENDWFADDDEFPEHTVYLDAYWMDKTEVTNTMYQLCVSGGACEPPRSSQSFSREHYYGNSTYDDYPVIFVSWYDAEDYCEWVGRRLPTEAEWEKAARGEDGRTFPWGEEFDCYKANYGMIGGGCVGDTTESGNYPVGASPFSVLDLSGNVSEWVMDWYQSDYYTNSPNTNPKGPDSGEYRVLRGGSWYYYDRDIRTASRGWGDPDNSDHGFGIRCARSSLEPKYDNPDSSHGEYSQSTTYIPSKKNYALQFDGMNDFVSIPIKVAITLEMNLQ